VNRFGERREVVALAARLFEQIDGSRLSGDRKSVV
jgi:hypothetical protein